MHRTRSGADGRTFYYYKNKVRGQGQGHSDPKMIVTLPHPKMHPHTKFGIPTSKNIGDMQRTRSGTDGRTDSAITICLPKLLWGHKNNINYEIVL